MIDLHDSKDIQILIENMIILDRKMLSLSNTNFRDAPNPRFMINELSSSPRLDNVKIDKSSKNESLASSIRFYSYRFVISF